MSVKPPFTPVRKRILEALRKERKIRKAAEKECRRLRREVAALKRAIRELSA